MRRMFCVTGMSLLMALASSYANAATVYDLVSKKRAATPTYTQDIEGLLLTASGLDGGADSNVSVTSKGIGVYGGRKDKWEVDGAKSTETLWLTFSANVTLESLTFSGINRKNDNLQLLDADGNQIGDIINLASLGKGGKAVLDLTSLNLVGTKFGFGALGKKDSFLLRQVSASLAEVGNDDQGEIAGELNIAHAPLPAPVLTGGALLAAIGVARLYRRLHAA